MAYRPEKRAKAEYRSELRKLAEQMPADYADKLMLVTDRSFTREQAYNADLFHKFRRFPDPEADHALDDAEGSAVAVLNHNRVMAYLVPADTYEAMLDRLDDLDLLETARARANEQPADVSIDEL
ncbi:hypothetical protein [Roseobacter weihaiensis]|uniref:hypothetical protein n=1 Tax=Roseobacter weihaiensis TaxID=2763262 RepID=UPI001D0AB54F|nr:hypothetical protein [Roseobacter sp. H9]